MIWKALADPTRRSILNFLKKAPHTTGELSEKFSNLSRYAVMKHLGVLEKANLITVRREGKYRWNHLNSTPIQQTYEQWMRNLMQLQLLVNQSPEEMGERNTISTTTIFVETTIAQPQARVWHALTEETNRWWQPEFYEHPNAKNLILESKVGGKFYEDAGQNEGLLRASVIGINSPHSLQLQGQLGAKAGGPAISFIHIQLEAQKQRTLLKLSDSIFGPISKALENRLSEGWTAILEKGLKPYLEQIV